MNKADSRTAVAGFAIYGLSQLVSFREGPGHVLSNFRRMMGAEETDEFNVPKSWQGQLVTCPACLGFWVALPISLLIKRPSKWGDALLYFLGAYGVHAFLHTRGYEA